MKPDKRLGDYKKLSSKYWNKEYQEIDWKVTHNAGSKDKTFNLASREIDFFLDPTEKKMIDLLEDKENNPYPTFSDDFWPAHSKLSDYLEDFSTKKVLDYGCGSLGRYSIELSKRFGFVWGVDIASEAINRAKAEVKSRGVQNVRLLQNDGTSIPLPSNFVDFIFSNLVLQHIGNIEVNYALADEFIRVLKPGGVMRIEYLDGSQRKRDGHSSPSEGNGITRDDLEKMYSAKDGIKIESISEGHPWLWVTITKEKS